jgi:hypothetical protein
VLSLFPKYGENGTACPNAAPNPRSRQTLAKRADFAHISFESFPPVLRKGNAPPQAAKPAENRVFNASRPYGRHRKPPVTADKSNAHGRKFDLEPEL